MFKKDKRRPSDGPEPTSDGRYSPLLQGKTAGRPNTPSKLGEPAPLDSYYEEPRISDDIYASIPYSKPSASTVAPFQPPPRPTVPSSAVRSSALHSAHQRGSKSATTAAEQIKADIQEVRNIIANYVVEPIEMLHLVDRWLQQLLGEFLEQRDRFKHQLGEKWRNQELTNIEYDNNDRIRKIYGIHKQLEQARDVVLSRETFDELTNYLAQTNNTTDELKEKVNSLILQYFKILKCLEYVDEETKVGAGMDDKLDEMKKHLSKLKQLNEKQSHTICIVGLEKAGKSTFINALLGYELLPTASERCTQVRTVLKPLLDDGDQQLFATVKFYNEQEFNVYFDKMIMKTDENEEQLRKRKEEVIQRREILKAKFPEEQFRIGGSNNLERERMNIIEQIHDYITGEVYVNIVKEIAIYTDKLPGRNYELLDVPGFDSPIKEHRDAGLEAVKSADAFIFLTNGQQPSLTEPQIRLLREIQQNHFEAMQRAFGVITKLDLCQTPTTYRDHYRKASAELIEKRFNPEHIYTACPRIQLLKENSDEYRIIDRKLRTFGDDLVEGFERSKAGLNKFIEYELPKTHLKQLVDLGRKRLVRYVIERLDKIKEKQLLPQNLAMMSIDEYIEQQNNECWDKTYYDKIFQPVFDKANHWHTTTMTQERARFIDDATQKFHDCFMDLTGEFVRRTHPIEQVIYQKHGYSKLQLNAHPFDNDTREALSMELEKMVDRTSDILAEHFYYKYICEMENILNEICPQMKDLYRTSLTLEKCINETHALILRVSRPVIMATLRYSYLDYNVKQDAISELIYIVPAVAFNIANNADQDRGNGILGREILKTAELLANTNGATTPLIRALFKK